jgi:hypothetical protein
VLCPGVSGALNAQGPLNAQIPGRGCPICAQCLNEARTQAGYTNPFTDHECCPTSLYPPWSSGMCWLCPWPSTCPYLVTISWLLYQAMIVIAFNWVVEIAF